MARQFLRMGEGATWYGFPIATRGMLSMPIETKPEPRDREYYNQKYYSFWSTAMVAAERDPKTPRDRYERILGMYNVYRERCGW